VRLLGPLDVVTGGVPQPVPGLRRKALLAVLALSPGEVISTDRLIDVVWNGRPPATALNTLQRHVSALRALFADRDLIVARAPGYLLDLKDDGTDLQIFTRLLAEARSTSDPARRAARLQEALDLWRGPPLADLSGLTWLDGQAERLAALRLDTLDILVDTRLQLGQHADLVAELSVLTGQHPYRERLHAQLMLALYRSGQQAEALAVYRRLRRNLADDLGPLLEELARAGLVVQHTAGRFTFHDLLRIYAADLASEVDAEGERHAAVRRMLNHYLRTAYTADRLLYPARDPLSLPAGPAGVTPEAITGADNAQAWFAAEHRVLLAAIDAAVAAGLDEPASLPGLGVGVLVQPLPL
jgi:DNA-binding SARP family transcriptional activator